MHLGCLFLVAMWPVVLAATQPEPTTEPALPASQKPKSASQSSMLKTIAQSYVHKHAPTVKPPSKLNIGKEDPQGPKPPPPEEPLEAPPAKAVHPELVELGKNRTEPSRAGYNRGDGPRGVNKTHHLRPEQSSRLRTEQGVNAGHKPNTTADMLTKKTRLSKDKTSASQHQKGEALPPRLQPN